MTQAIGKPRAKRDTRSLLSNDPLWFKDAIIYETHVRAFLDSTGDGVGDFPGLTSKLDYLRDLGVTAVWLLPFYPSPLRDDGYDIADYTSVNPSYGTLRDFQAFLRAAHQRGIRVVTELVLNHTSDQHRWFQRARNAPAGSRYRDFYVWSDNPNRYADARIIFKDFEASNWSWDPVAAAYYWHRFYHHQPDLNYDSRAVRRAVLQVLHFWLEMGVDGVRLDALPYLYEREQTSCENLQETHAFLRELRAYADEHFRNRVFLGEANQWPEDAAAYFGSGDECQMAFHFPLMPRLFMSLRMEERFPTVEILEHTPSVPETCQWALFLRNHDELTLEMVTDSERDYMYRMYGHDARSRINLGIRRRLAPLLDNNRRKIELMNSLLMSLPGSPVIYYGDEIGMGDNVYLGDRNGVRTPMQWSADRNAGFSRADPQGLYLPVITAPEYHFESVNVEVQQANPASLLWWMKRLIALRNQHQVFGRGTIEFLEPANPKILAYFRQYHDDHVLVVANLSRFVQTVELAMERYRGWTPVEMFGLTRFPAIGERDYFLTLGPHTFYWFRMEPPKPAVIRAEQTTLARPRLSVSESWAEVLDGDAQASFEAALPDYLQNRRWYGGKARRIRSLKIAEVIPVSHDDTAAALVLILVEYTEGEAESYLLCVGYEAGEKATRIETDSPLSVYVRLKVERTGEEGVLYDPLSAATLASVLLDGIRRRRRFSGRRGHLSAIPERDLRGLREKLNDGLQVVPPKADQSNTSVLFRDAAGQNLLILKLFRRIQPGTNPEAEVNRFLAQRAAFAHVPPFAGVLEYHADQAEPCTLGVLQGFVANKGDAWQYTLDTIGDYLERSIPRSEEIKAASPACRNPLAGIEKDVPPLATDLIGHYLELAGILGTRTAQMHVALASDTRDRDFAPERFLDFYRQAVHHDILARLQRSFRLLRRTLTDLPAEARPQAEALLARSGDIRTRLQLFRDRRISAARIRVHGDYHLGQVLYTGKDFVIIDFEGEPARAMSERRIKRSPLRDVAGMLRSFHYASRAATVGQLPGLIVRPEDAPIVEAAADFWHCWVTAAFLRSYLAVMESTALLPKSREDVGVMLDVFLLDKAAYELSYELNNRPQWAPIAINGLLHVLERGDRTAD